MIEDKEFLGKKILFEMFGSMEGSWRMVALSNRSKGHCMKIEFGWVLVGWLALTSLSSASAQSGGGLADNPFQLAPDHATASVADLDKESDWYQDVLGFRLVGKFDSAPDIKVRQVGIPGYRIDLVWRRGSARGNTGPGNLRQGWLHVVFKTPVMEDLYQHLSARGIKIDAARDKQSKLLHFSVHDPEDNEVGFARSN